MDRAIGLLVLLSLPFCTSGLVEDTSLDASRSCQPIATLPTLIDVTADTQLVSVGWHLWKSHSSEDGGGFLWYCRKRSSFWFLASNCGSFTPFPAACTAHIYHFDTPTSTLRCSVAVEAPCLGQWRVTFGRRLNALMLPPVPKGPPAPLHHLTSRSALSFTVDDDCRVQRNFSGTVLLGTGTARGRSAHASGQPSRGGGGGGGGDGGGGGGEGDGLVVESGGVGHMVGGTGDAAERVGSIEAGEVTSVAGMGEEIDGGGGRAGGGGGSGGEPDTGADGGEFSPTAEAISPFEATPTAEGAAEPQKGVVMAAGVTVSAIAIGGTEAQEGLAGVGDAQGGVAEVGGEVQSGEVSEGGGHGVEVGTRGSGGESPGMEGEDEPPPSGGGEGSGEGVGGGRGDAATVGGGEGVVGTGAVAASNQAAGNVAGEGAAPAAGGLPVGEATDEGEGKGDAEDSSRDPERADPRPGAMALDSDSLRFLRGAVYAAVGGAVVSGGGSEVYASVVGVVRCVIHPIVPVGTARRRGAYVAAEGDGGGGAGGTAEDSPPPLLPEQAVDDVDTDNDARLLDLPLFEFLTAPPREPGDGAALILQYVGAALVVWALIIGIRGVAVCGTATSRTVLCLRRWAVSWPSLEGRVVRVWGGFVVAVCCSVLSYVAIYDTFAGTETTFVYVVASLALVVAFGAMAAHAVLVYVYVGRGLEWGGSLAFAPFFYKQPLGVFNRVGTLSGRWYDVWTLNGAPAPSRARTEWRRSCLSEDPFTLLPRSELLIGSKFFAALPPLDTRREGDDDAAAARWLDLGAALVRGDRVVGKARRVPHEHLPHEPLSDGVDDGPERGRSRKSQREPVWPRVWLGVGVVARHGGWFSQLEPQGWWVEVAVAALGLLSSLAVSTWSIPCTIAWPFAALCDVVCAWVVFTYATYVLYGIGGGVRLYRLGVAVGRVGVVGGIYSQSPRVAVGGVVVSAVALVMFVAVTVVVHVVALLRRYRAVESVGVYRTCARPLHGSGSPSVTTASTRLPERFDGRTARSGTATPRLLSPSPTPPATRDVSPVCTTRRGGGHREKDAARPKESDRDRAAGSRSTRLQRKRVASPALSDGEEDISVVCDGLAAAHIESSASDVDATAVSVDSLPRRAASSPSPSETRGHRTLHFADTLESRGEAPPHRPSNLSPLASLRQPSSHYPIRSGGLRSDAALQYLRLGVPYLEDHHGSVSDESTDDVELQPPPRPLGGVSTHTTQSYRAAISANPPSLYEPHTFTSARGPAPLSSTAYNATLSTHERRSVVSLGSPAASVVPGSDGGDAPRRVPFDVRWALRPLGMDEALLPQDYTEGGNALVVPRGS